MVRPGMGYGRPLRPNPPRAEAVRTWPEADWFAGPVTPVDDIVIIPGPPVTNDQH